MFSEVTQDGICIKKEVTKSCTRGLINLQQSCCPHIHHLRCVPMLQCSTSAGLLCGQLMRIIDLGVNTIQAQSAIIRYSRSKLDSVNIKPRHRETLGSKKATWNLIFLTLWGNILMNVLYMRNHKTFSVLFVLKANETILWLSLDGLGCLLKHWHSAH